jgi:hypothetical protein
MLLFCDTTLLLTGTFPRNIRLLTEGVFQIHSSIRLLELPSGIA